MLGYFYFPDQVSLVLEYAACAQSTCHSVFPSVLRPPADARQGFTQCRTAEARYRLYYGTARASLGLRVLLFLMFSKMRVLFVLDRERSFLGMVVVRDKFPPVVRCLLREQGNIQLRLNLPIALGLISNRGSCCCRSWSRVLWCSGGECGTIRSVISVVRLCGLPPSPRRNHQV